MSAGDYTPVRLQPRVLQTADIAHTDLYVDGEAYSDVVAVEFSTKHLLLCIPLRADHDAAMERLRRARSFRVLVKLSRPDNPVHLAVVDETMSGFAFDRVNYRCCTHHFVAAAATERPSGLWVAELRFVASLRAVEGDRAA